MTTHKEKFSKARELPADCFCLLFVLFLFCLLLRMAAQILKSMKEYGWPAALIGPQVTALSADFHLEELLG